AELDRAGATLPGAVPEGPGDVPDGGRAVPDGPGELPGGPGGRTGRRARALADLDAAHAVLLGWTRTDLEHVLSTFPALRAREERRYGRFRTADLALAAFDRLTGGA
ncbi:MAG: hypothetical protein P8Z68_12095, partial [Kineosporiaceae bacterium]